METSRMSMYQLLESFCQNRGWIYAVFWRLKNQNRKLLTCNETYFNFPKSPHVRQTVAKNFPFNNRVDSLVNAIDGFCGPDVGDSLELAVANMSRLVYHLGEGLIGQIAIARKHRWICSGKGFGGGDNSSMVSEFPVEWRAQFAAGIKTIALVPVMPYGLVQLGSLETLEEDVKLVEHIRSSFSSLHIPSGTGSPFTSVGRLSELPTSLDSLMPQISVSSAISHDPSDQTSHVSPVEKNPGFAVLYADNTERKLLKNHSSVLKTAEDRQMPQNGLYKFGPERCYSGRDAGAVSNPPAKFETLSTQNWFTENCLEQNLANNVDFDPYLETERCLGDSRLNFEQSASEQTFANRVTWGLSQTIEDDNFKFPASSELHKALEQAVHTRGNNCFGNSSFADDEGFSGANTIVDPLNLEGRIETLLGDFEDWFMSGNSSEHLLDAMVADTCLPPENRSLPSQSVFAKPSDSSSMDFDNYFEMQDSIIDPAIDNMCEHPGAENMKSRSTDTKPSICEQKEFSACSKLQKNDTQTSLPLLDLDYWSGSRNGFVCWSEQSAMTSPTGSSITLSTLIDEVKKNPASALSKNESKLPKIIKKRAKPGESCRQRPRDRQQIQDRIKELREIVPSGAKCSIDALFERTIKHMLFLQSIATHVDKLKNCTRPKLIKDENSSSDKSNGASWAVELGSQSDSCPLIVENLSQPGHMLVEMLCEEQGIFLEIAQVIRSLGLTILKGEMETRAEKIWAHFVIEVTRGFQRMDILWPLMQLLQPRSSVTLSKF